MPVPIQYGGAAVDLSPRHKRTSTVTGSPAAAAETIIATLSLTNDVAVMSGIIVYGYCAFTAGTSGVSATLKLRQTDTSGTTLKTSGAVTVVAASLYDRAIVGFDASPVMPTQVYVMTLTIGSGSAASTVSAVELGALIL